MQKLIGLIFLALMLSGNNAFSVEHEANATPNSAREQSSPPIIVKNKEVGSQRAAPSTYSDITGLKPLEATGLTTLEIQLLINQNALIKEHHSSLLRTVYWSLSALVTMTALLIGFGGWSNFRMHEKDKERLKDEVDKNITELNSQMETRLANNTNEYLKLLDDRLERVSDRFTTNFSKLNSDLTKSIKNIDRNTNTLKNYKSNTDKSLEALSESIFHIAEETSLVEEIVWGIRGLHENALITQTQALEIAVESNNSNNIQSTLNRMKDTFKVLADNKTAIDDYHVKIVNEALDMVRKEHPIDAVAVHELLKSALITPETPRKP